MATTPQLAQSLFRLALLVVFASSVGALLAMKYKIGLNKILGTIHTYPTVAEANKQVASQSHQAHQPQKTLEWVEKFHRWERA